jgi:hypothetical protein
MQLPKLHMPGVPGSPFDVFGALILRRDMKVKIIINTLHLGQDGLKANTQMRTAQVWEGELDIFDDSEYLTKISLIAEGKEHPICDVPFSPDMTPSYWMYVGRVNEEEEYDDENFNPRHP